MNVLATGSGGYIGSVLVPVLERAGHNVTGYDTGWFGHGDGRTVLGDIRDPSVHPGWPDVVVHLAGLSNDPMGDLSPALTWGINYWGTIDFVSRYPAARHVVISSCAVYGQADSLCDETADPNPQTVYAQCKAKVDGWLAEHRPDATILRLGTVYGPSPNHRLDLVVNRMTFDGVTTGRVTVNGNPARPLVHVEDVASAIGWAIAEAPAGIHNVIGENLRMRELGFLVSDATGARISSIPGGSDTRDYMASGEKALRAGWHPTRTVAASLPRLIEASRGLVLDDHIRLTALRRLIDDGRLDPKTLRFAA